MDTELQRYYKKKVYGGRSTVARILDFIALRAFLLFFLFIIILYLSLSVIVSLLMSIFLTIAISIAFVLISRRKTQRYIKKDILRLKQKCMLEKLTFMNANEYSQYINRMLDNSIKDIALVDDGFTGFYKESLIYVFHNHPSKEYGVVEILKIYRDYKDSKKIIILSLSEFSEDAKKMCRSLPIEIELVGGEKILKLAEKASLLPDEQAAEKSAEEEMRETIVTLETLRKSALSKVKVKGYVICGIVIMCWPLITGFRIYYPIIAVACFVLAIISYRRSKQFEEESSDIGIT